MSPPVPLTLRPSRSSTVLLEEQVAEDADGDDQETDHHSGDGEVADPGVVAEQPLQEVDRQLDHEGQATEDAEDGPARVALDPTGGTEGLDVLGHDDGAPLVGLSLGGGGARFGRGCAGGTRSPRIEGPDFAVDVDRFPLCLVAVFDVVVGRYSGAGVKVEDPNAVAGRAGHPADSRGHVRGGVSHDGLPSRLKRLSWSCMMTLGSCFDVRWLLVYTYLP